jgi:predicted enzyme related to lactoylglutathione lyase
LIGALVHAHAPAVLRQRAGCGKSGESGTDDLGVTLGHAAMLWHRCVAGAMMAETPREKAMARLRHIAVCVKDLDKAAEFYAKVFEFKKIGREDLDIGSAIYMSDGVINMALLNFKGKGGQAASDIKEGQMFVGAHHFGIQVDDLAETQKKIEAAGGKFFFDLGDERHGNFERKFKDPDGVIFDISKHGWQGTDGYKK